MHHDHEQPGGHAMSSVPDLTIEAFTLPGMHPMPIVPASRRRSWMSQTSGGFAYHCLPLVVANEFGWDILNPIGLRCSWSGGASTGAVRVLYDSSPKPTFADTAFGHGVLTFHIPYLFRTPPGIGLVVRGPANSPRDGITPLEGVVETSWATAKFTMNWKFTRPEHIVRFEQGEPLCTVRPVRLDLIERLDPSLRALHENPELEREYEAWSRDRNRLNAELRHPGRPPDAPSRYQRDYMRGRTRAGSPAIAHRTRLVVRPFASCGAES